MKKIITVFCILLSFVIISFSQDAKADKKKEKATLITTAVIDSQHYEFRPLTAIPMAGEVRNLTYGFVVTISKDTIESYLPYFGRAYSVDYGSTTSPLEFISANFGYSVQNLKKGGWDIAIEPKDAKEIRKLLFTIYPNGNASLQVLCNNRQPINFQGEINAVKLKKEKEVQ
jgi:hypothetical protein